MSGLTQLSGLWIAPITMLLGVYFGRKHAQGKTWAFPAFLGMIGLITLWTVYGLYEAWQTTMVR